MLKGNDVDSVKVSKSSLRNTIQINRDAHRAEFEQALEGYRIACITALERNLAALKTGKAERVFINEQLPEDHTSDYDRVLKMLAMSVEQDVVLSSENFDQYVLNNWHWRHVWVASNTKYLNNAT